MMPLQTEIVGLLGDCARMLGEFYPTISIVCLQLHHHVIPFLPVESRLSQVYGRNSQSSINVKDGQEQMWSQCIRILEGHSKICTCVAFSPDGERLVSGSYDCTVRLWNTSTGALLQVMAGHKDTVHSVVYSPNGMLIASCSEDCTIRIWGAVTGLQVDVYAGHLD